MFPMNNLKHGGKTAILNLQSTKVDKKANLVIHSYADTIFDKLMKRLGIEEIPDFDTAVDPTRFPNISTWNIDQQEVNKYEELYKKLRLKSSSSKKHKTNDQKPSNFETKKIKAE